MVAKTFFGLEEVLANELLKLGARDIEAHTRAVSFTGDTGFMYKANLNLRTALKILKPIASFTAKTPEQLYHHVKKISWGDYLNVTGTFLIDPVVNSTFFTHSEFAAQKTKDAIADYFREHFNERPSVDKEDPVLRINLHIAEDKCTISLDSSGESLHKRGYRTSTGRAPLNEVLAAGMVLLSGWDKQSLLIDPMCGSGTILIEAALYACNIPPGYFREGFAFEKWKDFDEALWNKIYDLSVDKITENRPQLIGADQSYNNIKKAKENCRGAKVDDIITFETADFEAYVPPAEKSTVIMNPPYGERMDKDNPEELYKKIGDTLKAKYNGYDAWLISSNIEALKNVGLRPSRKITLYNGPLECKFMKYEMYKGTKKLHKLRD